MMKKKRPAGSLKGGTRSSALAASWKHLRAKEIERERERESSLHRTHYTLHPTPHTPNNALSP